MILHLVQDVFYWCKIARKRPDSQPYLAMYKTDFTPEFDKGRFLFQTQRHVIRSEIRTAMTSAIGAKESGGKKDLLRIALLLREANKISQKLNKNIVSVRVFLILI